MNVDIQKDLIYHTYKEGLMYSIFVITHKNIFDFVYTGERLCNFKFMNVSDSQLQLELYDKYNVVDIKQTNFINLGKHYTESEVIYNVYKNNLYESLPYIGFIHYDVGTKQIQTNVSLTAYLDKYLDSIDHINLQPFDFNWDYYQRILADANFPETLVGDGKNCYDFILEKYNEFYNTKKTINDLSGIINLCSCFILKVEYFKLMMSWISWIIETKCLDVFDTLHRYRIQGGLLERFYAVWLKLNVANSYIFAVDHMCYLKNS